MKCELCEKEVKELKKLFDKKVCQRCIDEFEECIDANDLTHILKRRGSKWCLKNLK